MADQVIAGRYEILSKLGAGGAAVVYKVKDLTLKNVCALKTLKYEEPKADQIVRFQREAKAISGLRHPNIVSTLDFGLDDKNRPYLVMDFVEGVSLKQFIHRNGPIKEESALLLIEQICQALSYVHSHDILHRDIKSANIMVVGASYRQSHKWDSGVEPTVKILDFGLAKNFDESVGEGLTKTGLAVGTPKYMSPEQCEARSIDQRSEVYSTGCLLFEMLTGDVPFKGANSLETIQMHINSKPPTLAHNAPTTDFSIEIEELVAKALAKSPEDRFQSMEEMLSEVRSLIGSDVENFDDGDNEYRPQRIEAPSQEGSKLATFLIGAITLVFIVAGGVSAYKVLTTDSEVKTHKVRGPDTILLDTMETTGLQDLPGDCGVIWSAYSYGISIADDDQVFELNKDNAPEMLSLCKQISVTTKGLRHAAALPVKGIGLDERYLTGDQLKLFAKPDSKIEVMYLIENEALRDPDLAVLKAMKNLKYLVLSENHFSDEALKYVSDIKSLVTLRFGEIDEFKGPGLSYLLSCPNLKRLSLYENDINAEGWRILSKMNNLEVLNLWKTKLTGEKLKMVSNLKLRKLDISKNDNLRDEDLKHLYNMKTLKAIRIYSCEKITNNGIAELSKALPECEILRKKGVYTELIDTIFVTEKSYD